MSDYPSPLRALIELAAIGSLGFAVALVFAPDLPVSITPLTGLDVIRNDSLRAAMFAVIGAAGLAWVHWTTPSQSNRTNTHTAETEDRPLDFETLRSHPPEDAASAPTVGKRFEAHIDAAAAAARTGGADPAREQLQSIAIDAIAQTNSCSRDTAQSVLSKGEWTADPVAAAYLADREATLPFVRRLMAWLRPARTRRRRIERAINAVVTHLEGTDRR